MASDAWAVCREIRHLTGLSQRGLAQKAGVTPATVARIEKGRMEPTLDLLGRLARAAGLSLRVVVGSDPDERKARTLAASLSDEERLLQNDRLSALSLA